MVSGEGSSDALWGSEKDQTPMVPVLVTGTMGEGSGSGLLNEKRKGVVEDERGILKMVTTDGLGESKPMLPPTKGPLFRCNSLFSDEQQQHHFSTPIPSNNGFNRNYQNAIFPSYHSTIPCARNAGVYSSNSNRNMHGGPLIAAGRPFTADQWMERNYTPRFSCLFGECSRRSSVRPPSFAQRSGQFTEQEPRRCRRNDGKRWRCRRDVVVDQKYCERHLKRHPNCSRRLVASPSNSFTIALTLQHAADTSSMNISGNVENTLTMEMQDQPSPSLSSSIDMRENDGIPAIRQENIFEGSTLPDLGLISSDSLPDPDPQSSNSIEGKNIHSSPVLSDEDSQDSQSQLVRHFIDDWPQEQSDHLGITWPEVQSDRTQLSISRPMGSSEGSISDTSMHGDANGVSISSEVLIGEKALKNANENPQDGNISSSAINVMTDEGGDSKPLLGSSLTDVLQNTNWGSSSNSSAKPMTAFNFM